MESTSDKNTNGVELGGLHYQLADDGMVRVEPFAVVLTLDAQRTIVIPVL